MSKKINPLKINQKRNSSQIRESEPNSENINNNYNLREKEKNKNKDSSITLKEKIQENNIPYITNITGTSNLNCTLNLRNIAMKIANAEYNPKEMNSLRIKLKNPKSHANIFANGKIVCLGVKTEEQLIKAIIEYEKIIKNCGITTNLNLDEIVIRNIAASCNIKFKLPLLKLYEHLNKIKETGVNIHYDKGIFPAIFYSKDVGNSAMNLIIFSSGKIVITGARKKEYIYDTFNHIYPELLKFKN